MKCPKCGSLGYVEYQNDFKQCYDCEYHNGKKDRNPHAVRTFALNEIINEYETANKKFPKFNSAHEGYAVLKEEVDELWDCIKNNKTTTKEEMRAEAVQVAAMALRLIVDCC